MGELLRRPILQPVGGLDFSNPSTLINYNNGFPQNMRYSRGEIRKREGHSILGSNVLSGDNGVMHLAAYPTDNETIRLLRLSKTTVQVYVPDEALPDSQTGWNDVTNSVPLSGGDDDYFDHAVVGGQIIFTNLVDAMFKYENNTNLCSALGGDGPQAKFLEYFEPYLVAGYVGTGTGKHMKIQWADTDSVTSWATGNAGSAILSYGGEPLRGISRLRDQLVAYKKGSIYNCRLVDTSAVIKPVLQEVGPGLVGHRAVVERQGFHYGMSEDDFFVYDTVATQSIGRRIREFVFPNRNTDKDSRHFALHVQELNEIWFFVAMGTESWPSTIWKYNYLNDFWYKDTISSMRAACLWYQQSAVKIADLIGTIAQQAGKIADYRSTTNAPSYVMGNSEGVCVRLNKQTSDDNLVAVPARFDTIDLAGDTFETYKRWLMLDFWAKGNYVEIFYSTDEGNTWIPAGPNYQVTLDGTVRMYRIYFDVLAEKIRFRFQNINQGSTFTLRQFYPYYIVREDIGR